MTDKIARFVDERWDDAKYLDGNELGDLHRETLRELGECAAEVDRLTVQRDAVEALARDMETLAKMVVGDLDDATARAEKAEAALAERDDDFAGARRMRDDAERRESELGLQVVAQAARLRLAALDKVSVVLAKAHLASVDRVGFMREVDAVAFANDITNEADLQRMLASELDFVGALVVEVES